jgi:UDPglucose 6-dehydrogenase
MRRAEGMATNCDALVVVTEWNEFKQLDLEQILTSMRGNVIIDGRNIYSPEELYERGFVHRGIGRKH